MFRFRLNCFHHLKWTHCRYFCSETVPNKPLPKDVPLRVFSGIQPTGKIHLGNYFGAVKKWVEFQNDEKFQHTIYSVVDLHAMTLPQNPSDLQASIFEAVATLLAVGINPDKSIFFVQSHVSLHSQLAWVLGCQTTMPRLGRLPQFKEKSKSLKEIPLGLYTYPVLQAADILLYNATHVPVGEDNIQQIQFAQHTAERFNNLFGDTFVVPRKVVESGLWCRVRSLRKPENKMSKSEPDEKSRIGLMESPESIREKLKKAVTDFTSAVTFDPEQRPGVSNLISIHSLCTGESVEQICDSHSVRAIDTGKYKMVVADILIEYLKPKRLIFEKLMQEPAYVMDVLRKGANKATEIGHPMWDLVCSRVGFSPHFDINRSTSMLSQSKAQ